MGIHGLEQSNIIAIQKLRAQKTSGAPVRTPEKDVNLTKEGSIFNAQKSQKQVETQQDQGKKNYTVAEGRRAVASAGQSVSQTRRGTSQTRENTGKINQIANSTKKLSQTTKRDEKTMRKIMDKNQRLIEKNSKKIQSEAKTLEAEVANQARLTSELRALEDEGKYSVYSLNIGGDGEQNTGPDNSAKINTIRTKLASSGAKISHYNGKIIKLRTATGKAIRTMNRTSKAYVRQMNKNQKTVKTNQSTSDKILNVANTVGEISQTTSFVGQGVQLVAKGMRYVGEMMCSNPYTAAAGAALISASVPVESTGVVVETVGQYGTMAADITKAAVAVAQGDIQGAIMNVGAAVMTGAAAVKGTQQISKGFDGIKKEAETALNKGRESLQNNIAKQTAKQQVAEQVKGKSKKEILGEFGMSKKELTANAKNEALASIKGSTDGMDINTIAQNAKNTSSDLVQNAKGAANSAIANAGESAGNTVTNPIKPKLNIKGLLSTENKQKAQRLQQIGQNMISSASTLESLGIFGKNQQKQGGTISPEVRAKAQALLNSIYSNPRIMGRYYMRS